MNMFKEETGIFGNDQADQLNQTFGELFDQVRETRILLGKQAYLLDKYLSYLFDATNQTLAYSAASDGFDAASELIRLCTVIVREEPEHTDHWFYGQAKKYIEDHPLDFQESHTRISIYCTLLISDFMKLASKRYLTKITDASVAVLDICDLRELYAKICGLLGNEAPMEKLNFLFCQRLLNANTMAIFLQGMTNQLLYWLSYRDRETSKLIFQLLNGGIQE